MEETKKPIRVAQVIGVAAEGGVEACIMNYYKHIDRTFVQFDFFVEGTSKIIDKDLIESLGGRVIIIPHYTHIINFIKSLVKLFKSGKYDIVHSNMNALSVFVLYAAKKAGIKIRIAHSHSTSNKKEWKKNIIKNLLRPRSKIFATNYFACSELAGKWLFGKRAYKNKEITIINNAIDLNNFKFDPINREKIRNELNIQDKFVVGHVGRFMSQKNHSLLLDIFDNFQKIHPNSVLMLIGDGELKKDIISKIKKLNIQDKVLLLGTFNDVGKFYSAMDCFVLPSLYEGLGIVGIEAQTSGLPCCFSNNVTKEVQISDNCFFTKSNNLNEYVQLLCSISKTNIDRDLATSIKNSNFNIEGEASKLLNTYETTMKGVK